MDVWGLNPELFGGVDWNLLRARVEVSLWVNAYVTGMKGLRFVSRIFNYTVIFALKPRKIMEKSVVMASSVRYIDLRRCNSLSMGNLGLSAYPKRGCGQRVSIQGTRSTSQNENKAKNRLYQTGHFSQ